MSRNRDPDFFAWSDSDLDLDELFEGDYTDNDSVCTDKHSVDKKDIYVCPICSREYKTIYISYCKRFCNYKTNK